MKASTIQKRLKGFGKVTNMTSINGNYVPNQFIITFDNGCLFKSYDSIIAVKQGGKVYLGRDWNYSRTTGKYRNMFLGEDGKRTETKLKNGTYVLLD